MTSAFFRARVPCWAKATSAEEGVGSWGIWVPMALLADLSMIEFGTPDCPYPQRPPFEQGRDICGIPWMYFYYSSDRSLSTILPTRVLGCSGLCSPLSTPHLAVGLGSGIEWHTQAQIFILDWLSHFLNFFTWLPFPIFLSLSWLHFLSLLSRTSFSVHLFSVSVF